MRIVIGWVTLPATYGRMQMDVVLYLTVTVQVVSRATLSCLSLVSHHTHRLGPSLAAYSSPKAPYHMNLSKDSSEKMQ